MSNITLFVRRLGWRCFCVRSNKMLGTFRVWGLYYSIYPKAVEGDDLPGHHEFYLPG